MTVEPGGDAAAQRSRIQIKEALDALAARADAVAEAQAEQDRAKEQVYASLTVACQNLTDAQRVDVARNLYWDQPTLLPRRVALGLEFAHEHEMRSFIGPRRSGHMCKRCGTELLQHARSVPPEVICKACQKVRRAEREADWQALTQSRALVLDTPVEGVPGVWLALVGIVVSHPPAVTSQDGWEDEHHLQDFRAAQEFEDAHPARPIVLVTIEEALMLLRAAEAVATWYPDSVDAIVGREVGAVTFSAVAVGVASAIAAAGRHAQQMLTTSGDELDVRSLLQEFRPSRTPHLFDVRVRDDN